MDATSLANSGAAMDRRIERPHAKRLKLALRIGLGLAALAALLVLWWVLPGSGSLAVEASTIRSALVARAAFADYVT